MTNEEYALAIKGKAKTHDNWLLTYYHAIKEGKIIVGYEMKQQIEKLVKDLDNPRYIYDTSDSDRRILFIETCCLQSKAPYHNKPMELLLWEKCFLECLYSFKIAETGFDRFKNAILLVARKNGKSSLLAGNALYDLFVGEAGQDICVCSIDDKTAKLIFEEIKKMAGKLDRKEKIVHKTIVTIENKINNTFVFKLSAKSKNLDGFNTSITIQDELHQDPTDDMAMSQLQSMSVRDNPKYIGASTNGFLEDGYLERKLKHCRRVLNDEQDDETQLSFLYTQDSENEIWQDKLSWYKSNPSLGVVKKWSSVEEKLNQAKYEKSTRVHVLCKDFNIKQNSSNAWLMESYYNYEPKDEDGNIIITNLEDWKHTYCIGYTDLSATTDLSCAKIMMMKKGDNRKYVFTKYFTCESKLQDSDDKAAGAKYEEWARAGLLDVHEGNEINVSKVADWFYSLVTDYEILPFKVGYDQRYSKSFLDTMKSHGMGYAKGEVCELINQSKYVLSVPMKHCEADLKSQLVVGINNMDKWCLANCCFEIDDAQNIFPVKSSAPKRIDGAATLIGLYAVYQRYRAEYSMKI